MDVKQLTTILSLHALWLANDVDGQYANLRSADLRSANLQGANLQYANLQGANLQGANLQGANLQGANLRGANLQGANLQGANLQGADLQSANLQSADLQYANLQGADLRSADLRSANLQGANLKYAKGLGQFVRAPKEGAIIGYKKAGDLIVKLLIPATAKRVNAIGSFKCRCDKAKVLAILNVDGTPSICQSVKSTYTARFVYTVGQLVQEPEFDPSDRIECSKGIHFFMTFEEAVEYF
jgi:hypothetical protein